MTEIGGEEIGEGGNLGNGGVIVGVLSWEGGLEENGGVQVESLQVGVEELTCGENPRSLEGVSSNHGGMGVVSNPLQSSEP